MDNNEYDETEPDPWYGWTWTNADGYQYEQMCEALTDHLDDESDAQAAMTYLHEVKDVLNDDREYTADQIADLFKERKVEYDGWAKVADSWIEDHYPGLDKDPIIALRAEEIDDIGRNVAASDSTRYWWHETNSGMVVAVLKPGYTSGGGVE